MDITSRQLNRATLARQLLLEREPVPVPDAVRRVVALQAQEPASPYLALWNRITGFDGGELDAAFRDGVVLKATLMRITMHAVHAADYPSFYDSMVRSLRAARLPDRRFTATGLSIADADALLPQVLEFAREPRTGDELEAFVEEHVPIPGAGAKAWWALRTFAPLTHLPTGGAWLFQRPHVYVAAGPRDHESLEEARQQLVWRYLEGFGPATVADVAQFSLLSRAAARAALDALSDRTERLVGPGRKELFDVPGAPRPDESTPAAPRLLPMWDSTLLAYEDRSRVIPPEYRRLVIRANGDVLPTLLVDGYVAGVWRPTESGIEATAFHPLPTPAWRALAEEAGALVKFLADRDPAVYSRYTRSWPSTPAAEVRVLAG